MQNDTINSNLTRPRDIFSFLCIIFVLNACSYSPLGERKSDFSIYDGTLAYYEIEEGIKKRMVVWDTKTNSKEKKEIPPGVYVGLPHFSKDGQFYAIDIANTGRGLHDILLMKDDSPIPFDEIKSTIPIYSPNFSPDGTKVVFKSTINPNLIQDYSFEIYDLKTKERRRITEHMFSFTGRPYFYGPDHIVVAASWFDSEAINRSKSPVSSFDTRRKLWKISIETGHAEELLELEDNGIANVMVSADKMIILTKTDETYNNGTFIYEFYSYDGKEITKISDHQTFILNSALSSDGKKLVYRLPDRETGSSKIYIRDMDTGNIRTFDELEVMN